MNIVSAIGYRGSCLRSLCLCIICLDEFTTPLVNLQVWASTMVTFLMSLLIECGFEYIWRSFPKHVLDTKDS
jgi:hypothetical protein